jgi:hypothetical protein
VTALVDVGCIFSVSEILAVSIVKAKTLAARYHDPKTGLTLTLNSRESLKSSKTNITAKTTTT